MPVMILPTFIRFYDRRANLGSVLEDYYETKIFGLVFFGFIPCLYSRALGQLTLLSPCSFRGGLGLSFDKVHELRS